jgi:hypothetical protein
VVEDDGQEVRGADTFPDTFLQQGCSFCALWPVCTDSGLVAWLQVAVAGWLFVAVADIFWCVNCAGLQGALKAINPSLMLVEVGTSNLTYVRRVMTEHLAMEQLWLLVR